MRSFLLFAGAAALAMSMPALADQGGGRGQGKGKGGSSQIERGGGHGRGHQARAEGRGRGQATRTAERGRGNDRAERRRDGNDRRVERAARDERRDLRQAQGRDRDDVRIVRADDRRGWRDWADRRAVFADRFDDDLVRFRNDRGRRFARGGFGCPPGLSMPDGACMPYGQWKQSNLLGRPLGVLGTLGLVPDRWRYRFRDDDDFFYRFNDDGFVYRFNRDRGLLDAIFPVMGNDLFIGEPMPLGYSVYNVPLAYRGFYPDSNRYFYRYDDGFIYRIDRDSMMVNSVVAMLTGGVGGLGGLGVGDPLPIGYSAYNMPLAYRPIYYDTPDAWYRYADGYAYRVDPETQLITAIISLLV